MSIETIFLLFSLFVWPGCNADKPILDNKVSEHVLGEAEGLPLYTGADQVDKYMPILKGARVGLLINQTSMVGDKSLVDVMVENGVRVQAIFAPEHGFRGEADAGAEIPDGKDKLTGIPIISIYGQKKAPDAGDLKDIDVVVFDVQDVGARFYTYLSTLKYLMEACARNNVSLLVLDRPNPNGHYVDGPILEPAFTSFVGVIPIPIVHGMTLGELAGMMNGEGMLAEGIKCRLKVVTCQNYNHHVPYKLPVKPSPNLPNQLSVLLYPSLCLFEGTNFSVGRGTDKQFQIYGSPEAGEGDFYFTPQPKPGAMKPFLEGKKCRGFDLSGMKEVEVMKEGRLNLSYILKAYASCKEKKTFFLKNNFIDKLAGTDKFRKQVVSGLSEDQIRESWQPGLSTFKEMRKKYLLYPD
ncbi:MAG: DUF1343 domain-containing protein [Saprospiraceae bacterium]|nr:DUF1343 domain-containing protein [Candidatus Parvibacillus calidus]